MPWWLVAVVVTVLVRGHGCAARATTPASWPSGRCPSWCSSPALTVVAEMCAGAGLFDAAAGLASRRGGRASLGAVGARRRCWPTVSTAVLSLDTTAVLLTPVVIALARHTRTPPLPFALAVLALANTASLVLPVSNLTNLLADHLLRAAGVGYLGLMWAPALAAIVVTVAVLAVRDRRSLRGALRRRTRRTPVRDRTLLVVVRGRGRRARGRVRRRRADGTRPRSSSRSCCSRSRSLRHQKLPVAARDLVPWRTLLVVLGLFVVVETAHAHGLGTLLAAGGRAPATRSRATCCRWPPSARSRRTRSTTCPPTSRSSRPWAPTRCGSPRCSSARASGR